MEKLENYKLDLANINGGADFGAQGKPLIKVRQRNRLFGGTMIVVITHNGFLDNDRTRTGD